MCAVSKVMNQFHDRWKPRVTPPGHPPLPPRNFEPAIRDEEIREFRTLLRRAREYDKRHNQTECQHADKREALLRLAAELGADVSFINDEADSK